MPICFGTSEFSSGATSSRTHQIKQDLLDRHYIISDVQKINSGNWEGGGPLPKVSDLLIPMDNGKPVQQNLPHPSK